jgi:MYXO-CTERM domain-containing protein
MKAKLATCFTLAATMFVATTASADKLPDPVTIEITSPAHGMMFEGAPTTLDVVTQVTGTADDIELLVDDVSVAQVPAAAPWTFTSIELAEGMHSLQAIAYLDGVGYGSPTISVAVVAGGETGGEGTGTDGGSGGETTAGGTTSEGGGESGGSSGGCSITGATGGAGLLGLGLFGFAILGLTRRRA